MDESKRSRDEYHAYRGKHSAQKPPTGGGRTLTPQSPIGTDGNNRSRRQREAEMSPSAKARYNTISSTDRHKPQSVNGYDYEAFAKKLESKRAQRARARRRHRVLVGVVILIAALCTAIALFMTHVNNVLSLDGDTPPLTQTNLDEPFYMLLVGSDWRENSGITSNAAMSGDQQRADVMILARIDRKNATATLLTIPRDTPYQTEDGSYIKLNETYNQGRATALVPAVESIVGVSISHYAEVYFSDFESLVDSLGGIEVNVPFDTIGTDMLTGEEIELHSGRQTLNGKETALLARLRHEYGADEDANRQATIRIIVEAMLAKARTVSPLQYPAIIANGAQCVRTDMTLNDLLYVMSAFYGNITIYNGTGPSAGSINEAAGGLWLCYQDPQGWSNVMAVVDSGGDPSSVSYTGDIAIVAGTEEMVTIE